MKNLKKTNEGVTLIALVITIIVLLILAGVTIATLTDDSGIIKQANDAKLATITAEEQEKAEIATVYSIDKNGKLDPEKFEEKTGWDKVTGNEDDGAYIYKKDEDSYISVNTDGEIKPIGPHGLGDVNDDGKIDNNDVKLIQEFIAEIKELTEEEKIRADINQNNIINIYDSTLLLKFIKFIGNTEGEEKVVSPYGLGDVNDDGKIDDDDVMLIRQFLVGNQESTEQEKSKMDIDQSGVINIDDATRLQMIIAGIVEL